MMVQILMPARKDPHTPIEFKSRRPDQPPLTRGQLDGSFVTQHIVKPSSLALLRQFRRPREKLSQREVVLQEPTITVKPLFKSADHSDSSLVFFR